MKLGIIARKRNRILANVDGVNAYVILPDGKKLSEVTNYL